MCNHVTTFERPLLACKNISYHFRMQKVSLKGETNAKARQCNLQSHLGREGANSAMIAKDKQKKQVITSQPRVRRLQRLFTWWQIWIWMCQPKLLFHQVVQKNQTILQNINLCFLGILLQNKHWPGYKYLQLDLSILPVERKGDRRLMQC